MLSESSKMFLVVEQSLSLAGPLFSNIRTYSIQLFVVCLCEYLVLELYQLTSVISVIMPVSASSENRI